MSVTEIVRTESAKLPSTNSMSWLTKYYLTFFVSLHTNISSADFVIAVAAYYDNNCFCQRSVQFTDLSPSLY